MSPLLLPYPHTRVWCPCAPTIYVWAPPDQSFAGSASDIKPLRIFYSLWCVCVLSYIGKILVHHTGLLAVEWDSSDLRRLPGLGSEPSLPAMRAVLASASGDGASVTCRIVIINASGKFRKVERKWGEFFCSKTCLSFKFLYPTFPIQNLSFTLYSKSVFKNPQNRRENTSISSAKKPSKDNEHFDEFILSAQFCGLRVWALESDWWGSGLSSVLY